VLNKAVNTTVVTYFSLSWSRKSSGIWFMSEGKYFQTFWRVIGTTVLENVGNLLPSDMTCIFSSTSVTQLQISHAIFFLPIAYIISSHTHLQTFHLWFFLIFFLISHHIPEHVISCLSSCNDISYMYFHSVISIFLEELKNTIMLTFLNVIFKQLLAFNGITTKCPWILGTYLTWVL